MAAYCERHPTQGSLSAFESGHWRTEPAATPVDSCEPKDWAGPSRKRDPHANKRRAGPRERPGDRLLTGNYGRLLIAR